MLYLLVLTSVAKAEIFNDIKISGNQRLSIETVIMFSDLATNVDLSKEDLNISIKKLYETNYFKDVKIEIKNKTLEIKVEENPIIQSIKIEGIKNKEIEKNLYDLTKKSEKYPFLNDQIKDQKNLLLNVVRSTGFYFAKIETIVLDNSNNSVDIIYSFDLEVCLIHMEFH